MFDGGIRPHAYCLPVAKRERHRLAVRRAATSGSPKFFLGTDSAPHALERKEAACGCAGIFNAPFALETYAGGVRGGRRARPVRGLRVGTTAPRFYGLPLNEEQIVLERAPTEVPQSLAAAGSRIVPFRAGETLAWRFAVLCRPRPDEGGKFRPESIAAAGLRSRC